MQRCLVWRENRRLASQRRRAEALSASVLAAVLLSGCGAAPAPDRESSPTRTPIATPTELVFEESRPTEPSQPEAAAEASLGPFDLVVNDFVRRETRSYRLLGDRRVVVIGRHRLGRPGVQEQPEARLDLGVEPAVGSEAAELFASFERDLGLFAAPCLSSRFGATQIELGHQPVPGGAVEGEPLCVEWSLPHSPRGQRTRWYLVDGRPVAVGLFFGDTAEGAYLVRCEGARSTFDPLGDQFVAPERLSSEAGLDLELVEIGVPADSGR